MTHDEAKLLLGLFRPDHDDPADPLFAEALSLLESDRDLAAWYASDKSLDREMSAALREMVPPLHLRDSLLGQRKILRPAFFGAYRWLAPVLALAAVLVLLAAIDFAKPKAKPTDPVLAALALKIPALTDAHNHPKAVAGDIAPLRSWLAEHGGASGFQLPKSLQDAAGMACEVTEVEGRKVTILCFDIGVDRHPHLYVVETPGNQPDPDGRPVVSEIDGVAVASWRQNGLTYFLAERGPIESVRNLL